MCLTRWSKGRHTSTLLAVHILWNSPGGIMRLPTLELSDSTHTGWAGSKDARQCRRWDSHIFCEGWVSPCQRPSREPLCRASPSRSSTCAPFCRSVCRRWVLPVPVKPAWNVVWSDQYSLIVCLVSSLNWPVWTLGYWCWCQLNEEQNKEGLQKLVSWYFEPSQPQRVTSWLKTMFNPSRIYSARKSSKHKSSTNHKIRHDTNLHKTKHTQTSDTKFSKN